MSRKQSAIWDYFVINPSDEITALCITCNETISRGGKDSKNFNTTKMRSHLLRAHHEKFDELEIKQREAEADKDEQVMKQRKLSEMRQLMLKELKEQKDPWDYDNKHKTQKSNMMDSGNDGNRFPAVFHCGRYRLCPIDG